jgi:methyl-accepting chemotaxis protein
MKHLRLSHRLILLLAFPVAGMLGFGAYGAWVKGRIAADYARLERNAAVLDQIGDTVHELQKERGRSGVFVNAKGGRFAVELARQRRDTDAALGLLRVRLADFRPENFGTDFLAIFRDGGAGLEELAGKRGEIDRCGITGVESTEFYTRTIARLLAVVVAMSHLSRDAEIAHGIQSYVNFLGGKEQAGIERATLAQVFTRDAFTAETFAAWAQASAAQETYFKVFASFASEAQRAFWRETVSGPAVAAVEAMRQKAFARRDAGKFEVAPAAWFDASTARIDLMKTVEDRLAADYARRADEIRREAQAAFRGFLAAMLVLSAATTAGGFLVIRAIAGRLRGASAALAAGSEQIRSAARQVSGSSQTLAEGASEQAAGLEETSASLQEISGVVRRNADAAEEAKRLAAETRMAAEAGAQGMTAMTQAMAEIGQAATNVQHIVKTIDEIAFQTKLLALNAAVEAARAGELGAGFSVVAEEVRSLAGRAANAAHETAEKIADVVAKSERGAAATGHVVAQLQGIVVQAGKVDRLVGGIAAASKEQDQGVAEVNRAVAEVDQVTQRTAATAEESAAAAEELDAQAVEFGAVVRQIETLVNGAEAAPRAGREATSGGRVLAGRVAAAV